MKKLSIEQMKKVFGGVEDPGETTGCNQGGSCSYYESGTGTVTGHCEKNSKGDCVCHAPNSSIVTDDCEG